MAGFPGGSRTGIRHDDAHPPNEPLGETFAVCKYVIKMNETVKADLDGKTVNCPCCGDEMERQESRLCQQCERLGCDPSTSLCMKELEGGA